MTNRTAYSCSSCETKTEELRRVNYRGYPKADYCQTCFTLNTAGTYVMWENCEITKQKGTKT